MFDQADIEVGTWAAQTLGEISVLFDPPPDHPDGRGVSIYLLDVLPDPPARDASPAPSQVVLRYLVTAWAETAQEAHRLLGTLVFAALDHSRLDADLGPLSQVWLAFGLSPRPGFLLRVPVRRSRPLRPASPVREPLVIHPTPLAMLRGIVLGSGGVPLANAKVEYPALRLAVTTDYAGRFSFDAVPVASNSHALRIKARGRAFNVTLASSSADEPVLIHADIVEEL